MEISLAYAISALALVGTVVTNDNTELSSLKTDAEQLDQYYYFAIIGTAALMVGWVLLPSTVASFFQSSDLWGLVYVGVTTTAQFAIGWML
jgi:hypothetical protein